MLSTVAAKEERLRAMRREVRWLRRAVVLLLLAEVLAVAGYAITRAAARRAGPVAMAPA